MTLADIRAIAQKTGADLTMGDLRDFIGVEISHPYGAPDGKYYCVGDDAYRLTV